MLVRIVLMIVFVPISSCIIIHEPYNNAPIVDSSTNENGGPICDFSSYVELLSLPPVPYIPAHLVDDKVYVETELVKSIEDHRRQLRSLINAVNQCR